jgi:hypothetical protein
MSFSFSSLRKTSEQLLQQPQSNLGYRPLDSAYPDAFQSIEDLKAEITKTFMVLLPGEDKFVGDAESARLALSVLNNLVTQKAKTAVECYRNQLVNAKQFAISFIETYNLLAEVIKEAIKISPQTPGTMTHIPIAPKLVSDNVSVIDALVQILIKDGFKAKFEVNLETNASSSNRESNLIVLGLGQLGQRNPTLTIEW